MAAFNLSYMGTGTARTSYLASELGFAPTATPLRKSTSSSGLKARSRSEHNGIWEHKPSQVIYQTDDRIAPRLPSSSWLIQLPTQAGWQSTEPWLQLQDTKPMLLTGIRKSGSFSPSGIPFGWKSASHHTHSLQLQSFSTSSKAPDLRKIWL